MAWLSLSAGQIAWWVLIALIVIVAIIAIVFAILAFGESQVYKPYRNIVRHDMIAKGDLVVDGDTKVDAVDAESLQVHKCSTLSKLKAGSFRLTDVLSIVETGTATVYLTGQNSAVRVDSAGAVINLVLPPSSEAPGIVMQLMKSQDGATSTVNITVATGDYLCDNSGCQPASSDPLITLLPNQADQLWIANDSANSWKPM